MPGGRRSNRPILTPRAPILSQIGQVFRSESRPRAGSAVSLPSGPSAAPLRRLTAVGQGADTRPWVITGLVAALAAAPALQAASLSGLRLLNFAPDRPWNYLA